MAPSHSSKQPMVSFATFNSSNRWQALVHPTSTAQQTYVCFAQASVFHLSVNLWRVSLLLHQTVQATAAWSSLRGAKRIQAELKQLYSDLPSAYPIIRSVTTVNDKLQLWRIQLCNFDDSSVGGKQLNEDLQRLQRV
jgi:hypothetical protein